MNGRRRENYETLLEVLKTLNNAMLHFESLGKELKKQRNINTKAFTENGRLKAKINQLTKQVEVLNGQLKEEF